MSALLVTLRPSGDAGDQSASTFLTDSFTAGGTPVSGTLTTDWLAVGNSADLGSIAAIRVGVLAAVSFTHGGSVEGAEVRWRVAADASSEAISIPVGGVDALLTGTPVETSSITSQPAGPATDWTWSAINALEVRLDVDYAIEAGEVATLRVAEMYVEVDRPHTVTTVVLAGDQGAEVAAGGHALAALAGDAAASCEAGHVAVAVLAGDGGGEVGA